MKRKLLFLTLMLALLAMLTMITSADSIEWTITSDMSEIIVNNQPYKLYDVEFDDSIRCGSRLHSFKKLRGKRNNAFKRL